MTSHRLLTVQIASEADVVTVRQRTWQLAELLGIERVERTGLATAVSEIARNALTYGLGGKASFSLEQQNGRHLLGISIDDQGPGIKSLDDILEGRYRSSTGMGVGLAGTRRLVEYFDIETAPQSGTHVRIRQTLPAGATTAYDANAIMRKLPPIAGSDISDQFRQQHLDLMDALERLQQRAEEAERLRKELEDTNRGVVALYAELDARAEQLREASELKTRFLSNMSHEFRTPLNSILALCGLLHEHVDGDLSSEQERQVTYIRRSAEDLLALVNDLLDIAKVESGRIDVHIDDFSIHDLFSTLRGALRPLQQSSDVELIFDASANIPALQTDERKLAQIVRNLVANALKFTQSGQVRVEARLRHTPDLLCISVIDTGTGIASENLDRIFEEFTQVGNAVQKQARGTGLGLPLSRRLAHVLGGDIEVESELHKGSTFTLRLPLKLSQRSSSPTDVFRVLVVDDDETFRYVISQSIRSLTGYEVIEASGGAEAIRLAREVTPDILVLDLQMPDLDGAFVLDQLSQDATLKNVPVIVASSLVGTQDESSGLPDNVLILPKQSLSRDLIGRLLQEALKRNAPDA